MGEFRSSTLWTDKSTNKYTLSGVFNITIRERITIFYGPGSRTDSIKQRIVNWLVLCELQEIWMLIALCDKQKPRRFTILSWIRWIWWNTQIQDRLISSERSKHAIIKCTNQQRLTTTDCRQWRILWRWIPRRRNIRRWYSWLLLNKQNNYVHFD